MNKIRGNKWNRRICKWIASLLTVALLVNQSSLSVLAEEISEEVCQCDTRCSADSVNEGCPVCAQDYGRCEGAEDVTATDTDEGAENPGEGEDVDTGTGEETEDPDAGTDTDTDEEIEDPDADEGETDADEEIVSDVDAEDEGDALLQEEVAEIVNRENTVSSATEEDYIFYDGVIYKIISDDEVEVENALNVSEVLVIPAKVSNETGDEYTVVRIGVCAFERRNITNITIPGSVTSIGNGAFRECSSLTSVTILEGATSIGDQAFKECSNLASITIQGSVTSIGGYAFYECSSLASITLSGGATSIGGYAFYGCSNLASITIPDSVTSIEEYAFGGCSGLTSITIPGNVTSIGESAFSGCSSLTSITIPDGVTSIGESAFSRCSSLESVAIPGSVASIGKSAFYFCRRLESITIAAGVTDIGGGAFGGCSSLESITIPNSVTSIGGSAFISCRSLESITISENITKIESCTFEECNSLKSVTIPDGVTSIEEWAFVNCSSLESITIPDSLISIEEYAFQNCKDLTGVIFPDGLTKIGGGAFAGCSSLKSITIPKSVTSIWGIAFWRCSSLTNVTILNDKIDMNIGYSTFADCTNLKYFEIAVSENITGTPNVVSDCFSGCPDDRYLTFRTEDGTTELSETTTPKLSDAVEAYDAADRIDNDGMWYGWKLTKAVTVSVKKDNIAWDTSGKSFALSSDNGSTFITDLTNNVPAGTYTIYETTGATDSASYVNTRVTVEVTDSDVGATVNYYTVTFYDGDTPLGEPQIVLNNTTVSAPSPSPVKDGYTLSWVTYNTDGSSTEFDLNDPITAKTDIYASWTMAEEKTFTITALAGTGGSVTPSGAVTVNSGANQQFTITPDDGYRVSSVLVDGVEQLNSTQASDHSRAGISDAGNNVIHYDFENVTGNHTLTAAFAATSTGGGGSGDTGDDDPDDNNGGGGSGGGGSTGGGGSGGGGSTGGGGSGGGSGTGGDGSGGGDTGDGSGGSDGYGSDGSDGDTGGGGSDNSGGDSAGSSTSDGSGKSASTALSDKSVKNGANVISVNNTASASKDSEPKTGDASHMEIYATLAMIAGLSYLLLYFADGKNGMTEEEKKEIVAALVTWAKNGSRVKKYAALAVIFLILVYYHSVGKRTTVDWKEVYEK